MKKFWVALGGAFVGGVAAAIGTARSEAVQNFVNGAFDSAADGAKSLFAKKGENVSSTDEPSAEE